MTNAAKQQTSNADDVSLHSNASDQTLGVNPCLEGRFQRECSGRHKAITCYEIKLLPWSEPISLISRKKISAR
jgi:hypothetical protein